MNLEYLEYVYSFKMYVGACLLPFSAAVWQKAGVCRFDIVRTAADTACHEDSSSPAAALAVRSESTTPEAFICQVTEQDALW